MFDFFITELFGDCAEKKPAYQSSVKSQNDLAKFAVDGIYPSQSYSNPYTCLQTSEEGYDNDLRPYLLVDFGHTYMVLAVNITNRQDRQGMCKFFLI